MYANRLNLLFAINKMLISQKSRDRYAHSDGGIVQLDFIQNIHYIIPI